MKPAASEHWVSDAQILSPILAATTQKYVQLTSTHIQPFIPLQLCVHTSVLYVNPSHGFRARLVTVVCKNGSGLLQLVYCVLIKCLALILSFTSVSFPIYCLVKAAAILS